MFSLLLLSPSTSISLSLSISLMTDIFSYKFAPFMPVFPPYLRFPSWKSSKYFPFSFVLPWSFSKSLPFDHSGYPCIIPCPLSLYYPPILSLPSPVSFALPLLSITQCSDTTTLHCWHRGAAPCHLTIESLSPQRSTQHCHTSRRRQGSGKRRSLLC